MSPVAWLLLPSGMFYWAQTLVLSFKRGQNSVYNEKKEGNDYVPVSKKVKAQRGRPKSGRSNVRPPQPDERDHGAAAGYEHRAPSLMLPAGAVKNDEMNAKAGVKCSRVPRLLKGSDLYVVRCTKTGFGAAQPCWRW